MSVPLFKLIAVLSKKDLRNKRSIFCSYSKNFLEILKILESEGFLSSFIIHSLKKKKKFLEINFKKKFGNVQIQTFSKLSVLRFFTKQKLWRFVSCLGFFLFNTCAGVLSARQAKLLGLGGNLLFYIF